MNPNNEQEPSNEYMSQISSKFARRVTFVGDNERKVLWFYIQSVYDWLFLKQWEWNFEIAEELNIGKRIMRMTGTQR